MVSHQFMPRHRGFMAYGTTKFYLPSFHATGFNDQTSKYSREAENSGPSQARLFYQAQLSSNPKITSPMSRLSLKSDKKRAQKRFLGLDLKEKEKLNFVFQCQWLIGLF